MFALVNSYIRMHDEYIFFTSQDPGWLHECATSIVDKVCTFDLMLSYHHLEILNHLIFELVCCKLSQMRQCSMYVSRRDIPNCNGGIQQPTRGYTQAHDYGIYIAICLGQFGVLLGSRCQLGPGWW